MTMGSSDFFTMVVVLSCQRETPVKLFEHQGMLRWKCNFGVWKVFSIWLKQMSVEVFAWKTIQEHFFLELICSKVILHVLCFLNKKYSWKSKINIRIVLRNVLNQLYLEDYMVFIHQIHSIINLDSNTLDFFFILNTVIRMSNNRENLQAFPKSPQHLTAWYLSVCQVHHSPPQTWQSKVKESVLSVIWTEKSTGHTI